MSFKSTIDKITNLITRKRASDPQGFSRAQSQGPIAFQAYLSNDLKKIGIDPAGVSWDDLFNNSFPGSSSNEDVLIKSSTALDEIVFEPWFQHNATPFERNVLSMVSNFQRFQILNNKLRTIKVCAFGAGVLCIGALLGAIAGRRLFGIAMYGITAADLIRISYNCYIKNYVCLAMSKLGGTTSGATESFFAWMSSATGLTPAKDPFNIIQNEISYEILSKNTICKQLYIQALDAMENHKKNK